MVNFLKYAYRIRWVGLVILALVAIPSLLQGAQRALGYSCDFQHDWITARLTAVGEDPYHPFLSTEADSLYEQGTCRTPLSERPPLSTPLLALLLLPIQNWDWQFVKVLWLVIQLASGIGLAFVVTQLHAPFDQHRSYTLAFLLLLLFGWFTTRAGIILGQTSLLTALLGFLAIWFALRKQNTLAGILMGIALCKFTMTWGLLVFFIVYRHYRAAVIAVVIQIAGFLGVALLTHESPFALLQSYLSLIGLWSGQKDGVVSLNRWALTVGLPGQASTVLIAALGLFALGVVVWALYHEELLGRAANTDPLQTRFKASFLIVWLTIMSLSFTYHRAYDLVMLLVLFALIVSLLQLPERTPAQNRLLAALSLAGIPLWLASLPPPTLVEVAFPGSGDYVVETLLALALLFALVVVFWNAVAWRKSNTSAAP